MGGEIFCLMPGRMEGEGCRRCGGLIPSASVQSCFLLVCLFAFFLLLCGPRNYLIIIFEFQVKILALVYLFVCLFFFWRGRSENSLHLIFLCINNAHIKTAIKNTIPFIIILNY